MVDDSILESISDLEKAVLIKKVLTSNNVGKMSTADKALVSMSLSDICFAFAEHFGALHKTYMDAGLDELNGKD